MPSSAEKRTAQVVLLIDEREGHLHPRWQRTSLKSLLTIAEALHEQAQVQLLTATHSPLILASAEPLEYRALVPACSRTCSPTTAASQRHSECRSESSVAPSSH